MDGERKRPIVFESTAATPRDLETVIVAGSSVRWGGIFAGVFTAILSYLVLMALGLAIAGGTITGAVQEDGGLGGLGIGAAIWLILVTIISLFLGGYASGRVAGLVATKVGRTQGVVVASIVFLFLLMQAGSLIGTIGTGMGRIAGAIGSVAPSIASNPQVQHTVEQALGDLNLRSPPSQVAQGIAARLLRGDTDAAVSYLAMEAGITEQEARTRIDRFQADAESALSEAGETAGQVAQAAGWALFVVFLLGAAAAVVGGELGARRNLTHPIDEHDERVIQSREKRAA